MVKKKIGIYYIEMIETFTKTPKEVIDEYMETLSKKCEKKIQEVKTQHGLKSQTKIKDDYVMIPTIKNYNDMNKYNYSLPQLKIIAKEYKLKMSGNKPQFFLRIFSYLYLSSYIVKIQKIFRCILVKKYKKFHGPAALNRKLCTNAQDFVTMEPIEEINFHQFLSYKDIDGFIYGFDIISLYTLFLKSKNADIVRNPYNRNVIPEEVMKTIRSIIRFSRILKIKIQLNYEDDSQNVSMEKGIELRALQLFQHIDSLGNYSNSQWFLSLNRTQIVKFVRELNDIWNYRAQLTNEVKRQICPPHGDPFRNLSFPYLHTEGELYNVKKFVLEIMEKFVNSGINNDSKSLGAYFILGALTLVNSEAATALPWLFQSFEHF
jgi:hypothetical protein